MVLKVPCVPLVCTNVEFVLSIMIKSVVVYNHLYDRRVCSFDRYQMVKILILRFMLNVLPIRVFGCSQKFEFKFAG
jgi:hypothetical protein